TEAALNQPLVQLVVVGEPDPGEADRFDDEPGQDHGATGDDRGPARADGQRRTAHLHDAAGGHDEAAHAEQHPTDRRIEVAAGPFLGGAADADDAVHHAAEDGEIVDAARLR